MKIKTAEETMKEHGLGLLDKTVSDVLAKSHRAFAEQAIDEYKEKLIKSLPNRDKIKEMMTKDHSKWKDGKYRRVYWDKVAGAEMILEQVKAEI